MGEAKRRNARKDRFLLEHPHCCFCGNGTETWDHLPPQAMFPRRMSSPELEFPACQQCNSRTRLDDMVVAYYGQLGRRQPDDLGAHAKALKGLRNNAPHLAPELMSANQKRDALRTLKRQKPENTTWNRLPIAAIPIAAVEAMERWSCKLTCALLYREIKAVPPRSAAYWALVRPQLHITFPELFAMLPFSFNKSVSPRVQGRSIADVFSYVSSIADDGKSYAIAYNFGSALCGVGLCVLDGREVRDDHEPWRDAFGNVISTTDQR